MLDYAELIDATQTPAAKAAMCAAGLTSGKQLLHMALVAYLNRAPFLPPDEEEKFLELVRRLQPDYPYRLNTIGRS